MSTGYTTVRMKIWADGTTEPATWLIDVNANPDVDFEEDFARSAAHAC